MLCMKAWVYGRVQGVGYRMFCRRQARELGIQGYAINLDDGRVEVMMVGTEPQLAAMLDALHEGPRFSQVLGVDVERVDPDVPAPQGFMLG
ncbi:acylphosphatase [Saccharospirillum impatiens]|uniref:acylphosphatase n=1 Tax=Saccharospirillum impatiens TaxID=169438 RepID=UPI0004230692|nr:acylphosphatase [Saccharospirillum impatiens]